MSGGSGPIDKQCAERLFKNQREVLLNEKSGDVEIFKNLAMNRVVYFPKRQAVYFVGSQHSNVLAIIESVSTGLKKRFDIEQRFMDKHQFFRGPLKVTVNELEARALLVAFRLNDISVCFPG